MIQYLDNIQHKDSKTFSLLQDPVLLKEKIWRLELLKKVINITDKYNIPYIFKGSFKKANRSRVDSLQPLEKRNLLKFLKSRRNFQYSYHYGYSRK